VQDRAALTTEVAKLPDSSLVSQVFVDIQNMKEEENENDDDLLQVGTEYMFMFLIIICSGQIYLGSNAVGVCELWINLVYVFLLTYFSPSDDMNYMARHKRR